jgi:DNA-binding Xre family transcriptional regulator
LEVEDMVLSYNKLFKMLIDNDMNKSELCEAADLTLSTIARLRKRKHISTESLLKICVALNCQPGDIMEITYEKNESKSKQPLRIG